MVKIIFVLLLSVTNLVHATNQATAKVGARVVSLQSTDARQELEVPGGKLALMSQYGDKDCPTQYHIKLSRNNIFNESKKFGTCSDIVRTKLVGDKLIISMPNKMDKKFTTYTYDIDKLTLSNQ